VFLGIRPSSIELGCFELFPKLAEVRKRKKKFLQKAGKGLAQGTEKKLYVGFLIMG